MWKFFLFPGWIFWTPQLKSDIWSELTRGLWDTCSFSLITRFPARLKYSQIIPVFKKGNKTELTSYRPISLLTSFSKIFEKLIHTRLNKHIILHKILAKEQFRFRSNTSTEKAIFQLINKILKALDNKEWAWRLILWLIQSLWLCKSWHTIRKAQILRYLRKRQQIIKFISD